MHRTYSPQSGPSLACQVKRNQLGLGAPLTTGETRVTLGRAGRTMRCDMRLRYI